MRPLDTLVKELEEGRLALDDAAMEAIRGRTDLAGSAERLALLERVVRVRPDQTLAVADEVLARWLIESLARDRFQKGQPALKRIWAAAGAPALSELAGHALEKMGEKVARHAKELDALLRRGTLAWTPPTHMPVELSRPIQALFELNSATAFDRLGRYLAPEVVATDTGAQIARTTLHMLNTYHGFWSPDPRWLDAAAVLAGDARLKAFAKGVLNKAGSEAANAALARAKPRVPATVSKSRVASGDERYLERYRAGEHAAVWRELGALEEVPNGPIADEVAAVARETMERVRRNVEKIAERLRVRGYKLENPKKAVGKPATTVAKSIAAIEKASGHPIPMSLRAFWEVVGSVELTEGNRAYREDELLFELLGQEDPLVVVGPNDALKAAQGYNRGNEAGIAELREPFRIYISPGSRAKYDPAGNAGDDDPHLMATTVAIDGVVHSRSGPGLPFVDYLRHYLKWGGFAGLERRGDDQAWGGLSILTADLERF